MPILTDASLIIDYCLYLRSRGRERAIGDITFGLANIVDEDHFGRCPRRPDVDSGSDEVVPLRIALSDDREVVAVEPPDT